MKISRIVALLLITIAVLAVVLFVPKAQAATDGVLIIQPAEDQPIRSNNGSLVIIAEAIPALEPGHKFCYYFGFDDAKLITCTEKNSIRLLDLDRGTHILSVKIINTSDDLVVESIPVSFHLLRAHVQ